MTALLRKMRPKSSSSGNTSSCNGRKIPAESTRYTIGSRFCAAMRWARKTFFAVAGKNAPAFTVASLAIDHLPSPADRADARHHTRRRRTAPLGIHAPCRPQAKFQKRRAGIDQLFNPLACRKPAFFVLPVDRRLPAAQPNVGFLLGKLCNDFVQRGWINFGHAALVRGTFFFNGQSLCSRG